MGADLITQKNKIAFLITHGFEEGDNIFCLDRMRNMGLPAVSISVPTGLIRGLHGISIRADYSIDQISPQQVSMVVISGGEKHLSGLLLDPRVKRFIQHAAETEPFYVAWLASNLKPDQFNWISLKKPSRFIQQNGLDIDQFTNHLIDMVMT